MTRMICRISAVICAIALTASASGPAIADLYVGGPSEELRVQAKDAAIESILAALRERYGLVYQSKLPLNLTITGNYRGSLSNVVRQLMRHYDFVIKNAQGVIELIVIGKVSPTPSPAIPISPAAPTRKELPI
jgi:hypothetical protein